MPFTQASRPIAIETPLGEDVLLLRAFEGEERISHLFRFGLELVSEDRSVDYDKVVGQPATIRTALADGNQRYWNGWISRLVQAGRDANLIMYHATIVPWLWFLDQTTDCRIFQNKTAPEIIQQIFHEYSFSDFSLRLYGTFVKRDYCVQYRESDFNFVSRLMEEEGIFYFFEHENRKHTLVLGDDPASIKPCPHQPSARYEASGGGWQHEDVILQWREEQECRPGKFTYADYNFETPTSSLLSSANGKGKWEIYDFPGEYTKRADGDRLTRIRLQEQQMPTRVAHGSSNCRGFGIVQKFSLTDHYREDLNQAYVLTSIHHSAHDSQPFTSGGGEPGEFLYENAFECLPATTAIRPARRTPVPVVQGCQTAVVVGPPGEEIFTDQYGRVKVQFHWDRENKKDDKSSCWIRVSYPWAGKSWGGIHIPRIGEEVVVDFIEGDPDRPIITGRVYNAGQMPPWGLPGQKFVSGFKTNTVAGSGYNELAFDDTAGSELIRIHGQHDMDTKIEHDERRHVVSNRTKNVDVDESSTIGNNRTEKVGNNEQITIGVNRTESVGADEKISIGASRTETVGAHESITVALTRTRNVGINEMVNIGGAQEITIGGLQAVTVGLARAKTIGISEMVHIGTTQSINVGTSQTVNVGANQSTSIGGGQTIVVGSDLAEAIAGNHSENTSGDRSAHVEKNDTLIVDKVLAIEAKEEIVIKTGSASIHMKKDGTITIQGKDITIKASGKINETATGDLVLKGSKILQN